MNSKLYHAIRFKDIDHLKDLIDKSDDHHHHLVYKTSPRGNTSLHVAVQFSRPVPFLEEICNRCPPSMLMQQNMEGDTPLHIAARLGSSNIVAFLIDRARHCQMIHHYKEDDGDDVHIERDDGEDQDGSSSSSSSSSVLEQLIRMTNKEKNTALHVVVSETPNFPDVKGWEEVAKLLLEADPDFEYFPNDAGETPLYLAVEYGLLTILSQILETCPASSHSGPDGRTVFHAAVLYPNEPISHVVINGLLEKKPHLINIIKEVDKDGRTALHYAASTDKVSIVEMLLNGEPSLGYMTDKDGKVALHHMIHTNPDKMKSNVSAIVDAMFQYWPDCWELLDNEGQSFLHVAAYCGNVGVIKYVVEKQSKIVGNLINMRDKHGNTPLDLARKSHKDECLKILRGHKNVSRKTMGEDRLIVSCRIL